MSEPFDPYRKWLGIPPKDQPPNHYRLLAVELFEDDLDIISNAADRLMAHVRTFQSGPHAAASQKLLNELAAARHCLLDVAKKGEYDQTLRNRLLATLAPAPVVATPQPVAPIPVAPVHAAPVPVAPIMASAPVAAPQPYPQPMQPFAAPQQPAAPYVSTTSRMRRKSAWPALAAVAITAALLLVSGYYVVQLNKRPSPAPAKPLAASANAPSVEPMQRPEPPANRSPSERAIERRRETAADRKPAGRLQSRPNSSAPAEPPRRVVVKEQPLDLGALVGKMAVGGVDLLKLINVDRDAVKGEWRLENGRLISPAAFVPRLAIPYRLPPEYILSVVVERIEGENSFGVGLVAGDSKAAVLLDGWYGKASGLDALDGQSAEKNASTRAGRVLRDNQPNTLVCNVTKHGIRVTVNGESIIDFQGDFDRLSWPAIWGDPLAERLELIGSDDSRFAISKLELTVVSDPANVAGPRDRLASMPNEPAKTAQHRKTSNERRTLGALINGPEVKAPVPDRQELAKAERQVRELFDVALTNASDPGQKLLLADKFMDKADESADATADRYVLLKMARDLAAESGGAKVAARAANEMANWFQVDPLELRLEAFAKAGKTASTAQQKQELFDAALSLIDDFIAANEFDKASKSAGIAQAAARTLKNPQLTKDVAEKKREAERIAKEFLKIRDDLARLDADESDPAANLAVGKFYCLTKGDWQRGLELLARGDDPAYKSLAE
ncbi:MAG TPA: hypothetical protein VHB99_08030, partial [Pirellulales bacterium]|nr:hypothetical protein [Pirellulales bacterium]